MLIIRDIAFDIDSIQVQWLLISLVFEFTSVLDISSMGGVPD